MHSNQQTLLGLFPEAAPSPELDQAIRAVFRSTADKLAELLPTNPNTTFALRALRQAQDAALLAATDTRNSAAPLPTGPASVSSSASSSTPASSDALRNARPADDADTERIAAGAYAKHTAAVRDADGSTPPPPAEVKTPRHRPPGPPSEAPKATGPGTPQILGPDGAPLKR